VKGTLFDDLLIAGLTEFSPVNHVSATSPPFLLIHGTDDSVVPFAQSERFCDKLRTAGVDCELYRVQGGGAWHAGMAISPTHRLQSAHGSVAPASCHAPVNKSTMEGRSVASSETVRGARVHAMRPRRPIRHRQERGRHLLWVMSAAYFRSPARQAPQALASAASRPAMRPKTVTLGRPCRANPPADSPQQ